jgi:chemotaxis protein CheY-P-specific phosphatase CheC
MKQIEIDYSLAKKKMHYEYELEKTKLEQNLQQFTIMAELTKQQFNHGHIERMEILQSVSSITKAMTHLQDRQSTQTFKETINILLGSYSQSMSNVKSLESTQNKLIGAR